VMLMTDPTIITARIVSISVASTVSIGDTFYVWTCLQPVIKR
jgi:hypothetical protein